MKQITKQLFVRLTALMVCLLMLGSCALAEGSVPTHDPSPAIYVFEKNADSVVGVIALEEFWIREYNRVEEQIVSMGSGVVIREGGYILTNNHVVERGYTYQILMPSGEKAADRSAASGSGVGSAHKKRPSLALIRGTSGKYLPVVPP